jgi:menaquinol-cytochrome c reductase iron-sulfur subunit
MEHESPSGSGAEMTRRTFLTWVSGACAAAIGAVLSASGLAYFVSPAFRKDDEGWVDVGRLADLKAGAPLKLDYVERRKDAWATTEKRASVWLVKDGDKVTAFDPRCTHLGCPFRWDDAKKQFLCPCHAGVFAVDGKVVSGPPPRPLDRYSVKVEAGRLLVNSKPIRSEA